jgi:hypothetical protein
MTMETMHTGVLERLYRSLLARKRPEDVAEAVLQLLGGKLTGNEKSKLEQAARGSLRRSAWGYTSMRQEFAKPVGAEKQITKTIQLFGLAPGACAVYDDPAALEAFLGDASQRLGKQYRQSNFAGHRHNKWQRKALGLELSKRQYNKRFRLLKRLEEKLDALTREKRKAEFTQLAKHGLAHHITWEMFSRDENTACFVAYYTARCNLRSEFTIGGQQRAYDEISDVLFNRCLRQKPGNATDWLAIAHVFPDARVLMHLTDEQKGILLGRWTGILEETASMLRELWEGNKFNRATMVVKKGNDSSTWNSTAGAWNQARDHWMNLLYSLGLEETLEGVCFGKVLRLVAADLAFLHARFGKGLDPSTVVWNELPLPWQVFAGEAACTRAMVEAACAKAGLDPRQSGWIAPKPHKAAAFRPTPELVHGVSIGNPFLAKVLRQHHCFSGKANAKVIYPENN